MSSPSKVRVRLDQFHTNVQAVEDFYKSVMTIVDGTQSKDNVYAQVKKSLDSALAKKKAAA